MWHHFTIGLLHLHPKGQIVTIVIAVVQKAKIEAKTKEQEDEQRLERGRKEREEILAKFSALSDTEKEALRDMYAKTLKGGVMFENWKKAGNEPERKGLFLAAFPIYLKQNGLI